MLIELGGARVLTDPAVRDRMLFGVIRRHAPPPDPAILAGLDAIVVSHLHPDHLDFPSVRDVDRETPVIVPRGAERTLGRHGFRRVLGLRAGDTTTVGGTEIHATPALHDGRRYKLGPAIPALGYVLRHGARSVYFAGDTDLFQGMGELAGELDLALLPIGGWGPQVRSGHLDPRRAARAAALLAPRMVVPIHWGTLLRAGLARRRPELLHDPARELAAELAAAAPDVEMRALRPGESLSL